jgi:hypothetical protein
MSEKETTMMTNTNLLTGTAQRNHASAIDHVEQQKIKSVFKIFGANTAARCAAKVFLGLTMTLASASAQFFCVPETLPETPDANMTVGKTAQGFYFDHRTSNGTAYNLDCDPYYVVDIVLPGSYTAGGPLVFNAVAFSGGFDPAYVQLTQATCPSASLSVQIYKRSVVSGTVGAWKRVNDQEVSAGLWIIDPDSQPHCKVGSPYRVVSSGLIFAYDEYWVKVLPKLNGIAQPARVDWEWTY